MQRVVHTWTAIHRSGSVLSKAEQGPMPASLLYYTLYSSLSPLSFLEFLLPPLCFSVAATAVAYFTTSTQGHITKYFETKISVLRLLGSVVNVLRVPPKSLRTHPHVVENRGNTMAPLFLRLTS